VGLERGPLSLVSTNEELLGKKSSGSCLESREYGRRNPSRRPRGTLYPQKLVQTSPTHGGRSDGIVRSRTQATHFSTALFHINQYIFYPTGTSKHSNFNPQVFKRSQSSGYSLDLQENRINILGDTSLGTSMSRNSTGLHGLTYRQLY
jgi:hypothetical protein